MMDGLGFQGVRVVGLRLKGFRGFRGVVIN